MASPVHGDRGPSGLRGPSAETPTATTGGLQDRRSPATTEPFEPAVDGGGPLADGGPMLPPPWNLSGPDGPAIMPTVSVTCCSTCGTRFARFSKRQPGCGRCHSYGRPCLKCERPDPCSTWSFCAVHGEWSCSWACSRKHGVARLSDEISQVPRLAAASALQPNGFHMSLRSRGRCYFDPKHSLLGF